MQNNTNHNQLNQEPRYQYMIKWKRPYDDSWMYHIPRKHFTNEEELNNHLSDHTETEGSEFIIIKKLEESKIPV